MSKIQKTPPAIIVPDKVDSKPTIIPPDHLCEQEKARFLQLAELLNNFGELESSLLAEYVMYDLAIPRLQSELRGFEVIAGAKGNMISNPRIAVLNKYTAKHKMIATILGIGALNRKKMEKLDFGADGIKRGKKGKTAPALQSFKEQYK